MPTRPRISPSRAPSVRASYWRTNADLTVNSPDGWLSEQPSVAWIGTDGGGGLAPLGPHSSGYGTAAVTRAISLITGPIASSPHRVLELGFAGQPLSTPRWLSDPMLLRPDARFPTDVYPSVTKLPRTKFWTDLLHAALCGGMGAFVYQADTSDQPLAGSLRLMHPGMLSTQRDDGGALCWTLGDDGSTAQSDLAVFDRDGVLRLGGVEYHICVVRNPASPVDSEGLSQGVFSMNPGTFGLARQVDAYASGTFRSGVPAGYLKVSTPGLQQPQADDLKARWMANHGNDRRSIAVLNSTTDFHPLSLSPVDAALAEMKTVSIRDIAFSFGIDPVLLNASMSGSLTYGNVRDYFRQHKDLSLAPWISAFQDVLSALLPAQQGVVVDTDAFTRPEPKERFEAYAIAIDAGILSVSEVRALEGLPPFPDTPEVAQPEGQPVTEDGPAPPSPPQLSSVPDDKAQQGAATA